MFGDDDRGVFRDVTSSLLCSFLHYKTSESAKVDILILGQRYFDSIHEGLNGCKYSRLINPGVLGDFVYNISFSHFFLKKNIITNVSLIFWTANI